jgi:hypothetical protein
MSASSLPAPGTRLGPCVVDYVRRGEICTHLDCMETRTIAAARCKHCDKTIGYEAPFYEVFRSEDGKSRDYAHASCHETAVAR